MLFATFVLAALLSQTTAASSPSPLFRRADPPATSASIPVRSLGSLALSSPGFAAVIPQDGGKETLFVSSFHGISSDWVYRIPNVATAPSNGLASLVAEKINGSVIWPNDVSAAPASVFGAEGIVTGSGFLVPGKSDGGIYYSPGGTGVWVQLFKKSGWFYHRVLFADMDRDGKLDIVSCRANKPLFGGAGTMLVWLKPTDPTKPVGPWTELELGAGCDALFTVADLDGDGTVEVIAASYFASQLNLFSSAATAGFKNVTSVKKALLDSTIGAAFDVEVVDVNGDGRLDLLVSNHRGDNASGAVYAYEIPTNKTAMTDPKAYVRHTLAKGFSVTQGGFNQASPGSAVAFYPTSAHTSGPVHIVLAGDAAQIAYVLVPQAGDGWTYMVTTLHNCGCTVVKVAVADVDGDGAMEVFVPCYDNGKMVAYTFGK